MILCSNSPRRKQLLASAGYDFKTKAFDTDESFPKNLEVSQIASFIAKKKNNFHRQKINNEILLTADTTVICNDKLLEKPENPDNAFDMLSLLSGNTHEVITGVCISSNLITTSFSISTLVTFDVLSNQEIRHYINRYKPFDKAGGGMGSSNG